MAVRNQNMGAVAAFGEALPEGCYRFRLDKVEDSGGSKLLFYHKCQTEPFIGRSVRENFDLDNQTALSKLKAYYKAADYNPPDGMHDPEAVLGMEFYAVVVHNISNGTTYANIAPWSITSLTQGPAQVEGPKA